MGRAQAAYRPSPGCSCSFDRFATQDIFEAATIYGNRCANAVGACEALPAFPYSNPPSTGEDGVCQEIKPELVLCKLWHDLSKEEQVRFSSFFSRMILKILNRDDDCNRENCT
jgi:hypothetical protein